MTRSPRLPRHRMAPGQIALFDPSALTKARHAYPDAIRFVPSATGRPLAVLDGGTRTAPAPVAVQMRRAA